MLGARPTVAIALVVIVGIAAVALWLGLPRGGGAPGATGSTSPTGAAASTSPNETWGPLAVVPPGKAGGDTALTHGTLRITDECVFLEDRDAEQSLLFWSADRVTWSAESHSITFRNVDGSTVTLRDGDRVTFGGGGDSTAESGTSGEEWIRRTEWVARPPASCPIDVRWGVAEVVTER
jgi:hypothetical protein